MQLIPNRTSHPLQREGGREGGSGGREGGSGGRKGGREWREGGREGGKEGGGERENDTTSLIFLHLSLSVSYVMNEIM